MRRATTLLLLFFPLFGAFASDFEQPLASKAGAIVASELLKDPNYQIRDSVSSDGYNYTFTIDTKFGVFQAKSETQLQIRLQEIQAIAELQEISSSEAFAKAFGEAAARPIQATANVIQNPVETAKGIPGGVKRGFENLGRWAKRTKDKAKDEPEEEEEDKESSSAASDVSKRVLGVTAAHRQWAERAGVDPYSSNIVLQEELARLAKYDAAGKFGTNLVRPKLAPVVTATRVNTLVWGNDPEALRKINEGRIQAMGVDKELSKSFLNHKILTPTDQTYILSSLETLKLSEGRIELIRSAISAQSEEDAFLYRDTALILERMQADGKDIKRFIPNPKIAVVQTATHFVAVLPVDKLYWTEGFVSALDAFTERHKNLAANEPKELWLAGVVTERARNGLKSKGWTISENLLKVQSK